MFYELLGKLVWRGGRWFLRCKYGALMAPKPVLVGGIVVVVLAALLFAARRNGDD